MNDFWKMVDVHLDEIKKKYGLIEKDKIASTHVEILEKIDTIDKLAAGIQDKFLRG